MRIISQDGKIDLPYEQISISIDCDDERTIIAYAVSSGTIWELAEYSKKEKAAKAMEMLRTEYEKFQETKSINGSYFALDYPKVFRFPLDSGV
jgi:hypothetical protein